MFSFLFTFLSRFLPTQSIEIENGPPNLGAEEALPEALPEALTEEEALPEALTEFEMPVEAPAFRCFDSGRPVAAAMGSNPTPEPDSFYERNRTEEDMGIRVYGSNGSDGPELNIAMPITAGIDVTNNEDYFTRFPPASSYTMNLAYFNLSRIQKSDGYGKRIAITNERPLPSATYDNSKVSVDFEVTIDKKHGRILHQRKTSLFFPEPIQALNPQDSQLIVHPQHGIR